jgi:hypothetical protein
MKSPALNPLRNSGVSLSVLSALCLAAGMVVGGGCAAADPPPETVQVTPRPAPETPAAAPAVVAPVSTDTSFSLSAPTGQIPVAPGTSVTVPVIITRGAAQRGAISLSVAGLPSSITAAPVLVPADATSAQLVLTAAGSAAAGTTNAVVRGTAAGFAEQTKALLISVSAQAAPTQPWCQDLLQCCEEIADKLQRGACIINAGVGTPDTCKAQLLTYAALGTCSIPLPP